MPTFGLTPEGFLIPTLTELREDMNARIRKALGMPTLDLSDRSIEGQLVGIICERLHKVWELGEAIYSSSDVDKAVDAALDALCILTGSKRRAATYSLVTLTLTGVPTSLVSSGFQARVTEGPRFETLDDGTIEAVAAWVAATPYAVNDRVTSNGRIYQCTIAGTSDFAGSGLVGEDPLTPVTDDEVTWRFLGSGTGAADIAARASETGAVSAISATITEIVTPAGGVDDVINVEDANIGRAQMTNAELRALRELELAQPGTSPVDAIRAALLDQGNVPGVESVTVFVNNTDVTNGDGMPPHSVEAMVTGGEDQDIWDTLLKNVAAGIATHGTESGLATDTQGINHIIKHTRPTLIPIYITITVEVDPLLFPANGADQIKAALVAYGDAQPGGMDARARRIGSDSTKVDGVLNFVTCYIGTAPGPVSEATVAIALRERATYDTSRIEVTINNVTP